MHGDFGSCAGFAGNRLNGDGAVVNFRHFGFKQAFDKTGMRAGNHRFRPFFRIAHVHNKDFNQFAFGIFFAGHLFALRQNRFGLADFQRCVAGHRVNPLNFRGHQFLLFGLEFHHNLTALCVANALADNMLCGLGGNSAEIFGLERNQDFIARRGVFFILRGVFRGNLTIGIFHGFDHGFVQIDFHFFRFRMDFTGDYIFPVVILFHGNHNRRLDFVIKVFRRNAFFFFQFSDSFEKFLVHFFKNLQNHRALPTMFLFCQTKALSRPGRTRSQARCHTLPKCPYIRGGRLSRG